MLFDVLARFPVEVGIKLLGRNPPAPLHDETALGDGADPDGLLDYRYRGVVLGLAQIEADIVGWECWGQP